MLKTTFIFSFPMLEAYDKVLKVIRSCKTKLHCSTARKMLNLFELKYFKPKEYEPIYFRSLQTEMFTKEDEFVWF